MATVPRDFEKDKNIEKTLHGNKDTAYQHDSNYVPFGITFYSTRVREWLAAMKEKYPELNEVTTDNQIRLKSPIKNGGTITLYPSVTVVVHGKDLRKRFLEDFEEMKRQALQDDLQAAMEHLVLENEPEEEVTQPTQRNETKK